LYGTCLLFISRRKVWERLEQMSLNNCGHLTRGLQGGLCQRRLGVPYARQPVPASSKQLGNGQYQSTTQPIPTKTMYSSCFAVLPPVQQGPGVEFIMNICSNPYHLPGFVFWGGKGCCFAVCVGYHRSVGPLQPGRKGGVGRLFAQTLLKYLFSKVKGWDVLCVLLPS